MFFLLFIPILGFLLLVINFILAPHKPYKEKKTAFECGYHSFSQSRREFSIVFFRFGLLYLVFDLELVLIFPCAASSYVNDLYGILVVIIFAIIVTLGFVFEIGKGALSIESDQDDSLRNN